MGKGERGGKKEQVDLYIEDGHGTAPETDVCHTTHEGSARARSHYPRRDLNVAEHESAVLVDLLAEADRPLPHLVAANVNQGITCRRRTCPRKKD